MGKRKAGILLTKYNKGRASTEEKAVVESWFLDETKERADLLGTPDYMLLKVKLWAAIERSNEIRPAKLWPRIVAAASIVLVFAAGFYFATVGTKSQIQTNKQYVVNDLNPGSRKAILTLGNGKKINLNDAARGALATESGITVVKNANGELIYRAAQEPEKSVPIYNMITTPRGGEHKVVLPDQSIVWLNAGSSLKFPVSFVNTGLRHVELHGEAYFEIKRDIHKPFIVSTGKEQIEVLGTHFNVHAYGDEAFSKTTLLEGSIKFTANRYSRIMKPGQMATNDYKNLNISLEHVDVEDVMAWKNGYFIFNNEDIKEIMKKLSRWYDFVPVYEGNLEGLTFQGNYLRSRSLANLLKTIELTNKVHFKIEERRVTVTAITK
ncbi:DUF4974 domain-containing protein [Pedobacter sp. MC2016-14]|uniref:FecR family protein n=1 Tax=Pedobacter sp. MC2016-14 TaxID=2897327 RepID=UPI001E627A7F|nr:FecR family protein [Pedobacter sp. MC2016-14]MCD0488964.1 DUF4974 domain-containing protein [Pedobacter sp. MC2016-14]